MSPNLVKSPFVRGGIVLSAVSARQKNSRFPHTKYCKYIWMPEVTLLFFCLRIISASVFKRLRNSITVHSADFFNRSGSFAVYLMHFLVPPNSFRSWVAMMDFSCLPQTLWCNFVWIFRNLRKLPSHRFTNITVFVFPHFIASWASYPPPDPM